MATILLSAIYSCFKRLLALWYISISKTRESPLDEFSLYFRSFFLFIWILFCRDSRLFKFKQILQICLIYDFPCVHRKRALYLYQTNGNVATTTN